MERHSPTPKRMGRNPRHEKSERPARCGTWLPRSKIAGFRRKAAARSRASTDDAGTTPEHQPQEAQLQKRTFRNLSILVIIAAGHAPTKDMRGTFTGQKRPSHCRVLRERVRASALSVRYPDESTTSFLFWDSVLERLSLFVR